MWQIVVGDFAAFVEAKRQKLPEDLSHRRIDFTGGAVMSRVDLAELDFFSPEVQECPFSVYQQLQDEAPYGKCPVPTCSL